MQKLVDVHHRKQCSFSHARTIPARSRRQDTANTAIPLLQPPQRVLPCAQSTMSDQSTNFTWGQIHYASRSSVNSRQKTPCHNKLPAQQQLYTNQLFGSSYNLGVVTLNGCLLLQLCLPLPQQVLSVGRDLCRGHLDVLCHLGSLLLGSSQLQRQ
jgi:hypothetical protein